LEELDILWMMVPSLEYQSKWWKVLVESILNRKRGDDSGWRKRDWTFKRGQYLMCWLYGDICDV
jgi:hypothetical protein